MSEQISCNMQLCSGDQTFQLGATGHAKVLTYMAYGCGGSFFLGLTRLIVAIGALIVDYMGRSALRTCKERMPSDDSVNNALNDTANVWNNVTNFFNEVGNSVDQSVQSEQKIRRVSNLELGIDMCQKDISSHWQQVARAIVEMTVIGGWIYIVMEVVQEGRSKSPIDTLDWGRATGMCERIGSCFTERQYVPEDVANIINNLDIGAVDDDNRRGAVQAVPVDKYKNLESLAFWIAILNRNSRDWENAQVREALVQFLNTRRNSIGPEYTTTLQEHGICLSNNEWSLSVNG